MDILTTDNWHEQVLIGKEIYAKYRYVYSEEVTNNIYSIIKDYNNGTELTDSEAFFNSVYHYWRYGFSTKEFYFFDLIHKNHNQKLEYISFMDRLNYIRHLNKKEDEYLLADKFETYKYLKDYYHRELLYIPDSSHLEDFRKFIRKNDEFVVKPIGLAASLGVRKCESRFFRDDTMKAVTELLKQTEELSGHYRWAAGKGIIVEELIRQGEQLACLHPASVNSVRITTIQINDQVHNFYPVIRIGKNNQFLCCRSVGSIVAGINPRSGIIETDGFDDEMHSFICHPDTGYPIKGYPIPKWDELCQLSELLALKFPTLRYIGWDFVYTTDERWIVMEANEHAGIIGQIAYQRGILKELQDLIGWKSDKKYWWIGKYSE